MVSILVMKERGPYLEKLLRPYVLSEEVFQSLDGEASEST